MNHVAAVIEELVVATVIGEKVIHSQSKAGWAFAALSALLCGAAGILLVMATLRAFEGRYPPDAAAALAAATLFCAAAVAAAIAWLFCRRRPARVPYSKRDEIGKNVRALIEGACDELDDVVKESPKAAMLLAAITGFFALNHARD